MISTYHWKQVINILKLHWNNYNFSLSCQRNQAGNSPAMEFLGFQSCMDFLLGCGVVISTFISDRHTQIASHMKTVLKNITHYFDLWHLKKSKRSIAVIRFYYNFSMEFFFSENYTFSHLHVRVGQNLKETFTCPELREKTLTMCVNFL